MYACCVYILFYKNVKQRNNLLLTDEKEGRAPSPLPSPLAPPLIQKRLLQGGGGIGGDVKEIEGAWWPHMKGDHHLRHQLLGEPAATG